MRNLLVQVAVAIGAAGSLSAITVVPAQTTGAIAATPAIELTQKRNSYPAQATPLPKATPTESAIFQEAIQATFLVATFFENERKAGATAFLVKDRVGRLFIVTNRHVCLDRSSPKDLVFTLTNENGNSFVTTMERSSYKTDLCVLVVPDLLKKQHRPLEITEKPVDQDDRLFVFGHPRLRPLTRTAGRVIKSFSKELGFFEPDHAMLMTIATSHIEPGSSGSAGGCASDPGSGH
ncbi:MAG: serine protease [Proteobacteria bacterium]|nr:MAG: serine protease [Pseudomonadota bacterium]